MESWDIVVVGGGVAALRAAISAADAGASVAVIDHRALSAGSGAEPTAGLAASMAESNSLSHIADTKAASANLCDETIVESRCGDAFSHLAELERWGLLYRRAADGSPHLSSAIGHGTARIAGCGDVTEREVVRLLEEQCMKRGIPRKSDVLTLRLAIDEGQVRGIIVLDVQTGAIAPIQSKVVILATDDHSGLWSGTSSGAGLGAALLLDAGVALSGMEFTAWHPLAVSDADLTLPIELLDAGARIRRGDGEDIDTSGATSTILSKTLASSDCILDARGIARETRPWFNQTAEKVNSRLGIDIWSEVVPLTPIASHALGGAPTDGHGRVLLGGRELWLTGAYAAGGSACSGMHGAEALAGNLLLDALTGGAAAGAHSGNWSLDNRLGGRDLLEQMADSIADGIDAMLAGSSSGSPPGSVEAALVKAMNQGASIERDAEGLKAAMSTIEELAAAGVAPTDSSEVMNTDLVRVLHLEGMLALGRATIAAANAREESRGSHQRSDHPDRNGPEAHILVDLEGVATEMSLA